MARLIGVAEFALVARIMSGKSICAICGGDAQIVTSLLTSAISKECRGLVSFGIAGELPRSALAARRADGTIDIVVLVRSLIKNPAEQPMLLWTALDSLTGFSALTRSR